jgi:hypothetical protein
LGHSRLLQTATGDIETVAYNYRNTSWQDIATRIRLSDLKRDRSHLGVEPTRLIKIVRGHCYQPEEVHSKGARAPRPMEQRVGKQQRGENNKTTRANIKRGKTGREQRNGTEGSDTPAQRHLSRVSHLHACEAQSRLREEGPSGGPFRPMPLMRIGV